MKIANNVSLAKALKLDGTHSCQDGLFLAVRGTSKRWVFRDRVTDQRTGKNTKIREATIGVYGDRPPGLTMGMARDEAKKLWLAAKAGTDPKTVTPKERAKPAVVVSLRAEAIEYQERNTPRYDASGKQIGGWDEAYFRGWMWQMEKHVLAHLGDRDSGRITGVEIAKVLRPIWHRTIGFKVATSLNAVYKRAVGLSKNAGRLTRNPMPDALAELPPIRTIERDKQAKPHGMMGSDDVGTLYNKAAMASIDDLPAKALQLLLLLGGVRAAEVLGMRWGEVSDDQFAVPGTRTKSGNDRVLPLVPAAVALLAELRLRSVNTGPEAFVFPSLRKQGKRFRADGSPARYTGHLQDDSMRLWLCDNHPGIDAETGKPWNVHGLRHCYTTWVTGWATVELYHASEFGLDHKIPGQSKVAKAYDRNARLPERRMILDRWAGHICP